MSAPDFREALEQALEVAEQMHAETYRATHGADAVLALLAERLRGDEVEMAAAKAILDARRHRWDQVHQGECITDARAALAALRGHLGMQR